MSQLKNVICIVSVSALTKSKYSRSVLNTQILLGESCKVLEKEGKYLFIETIDGLVGWVLKSHFMEAPMLEGVQTSSYAYTLDAMGALIAEDHHISIPFGSTLLNFDGLTSQFPHQKYTYNGQVIFPNKENSTPKVLKRLSRLMIGAPYLRGGMTIFGIDEINLVYLIYKIAGYTLSRNIGQMVSMGNNIDFVEQVQIGDIAYFENKKGIITHTGIIIGPSEILHQHSIVRIDYLDHYGIYNALQKKYTHKLRLVKRILPTYEKEGIKLLKDKKEITNQIKMF